MTFSTDGIALAVIRASLDEIHVKLDKLLDAPLKSAARFLDKALTAIEGNDLEGSLEYFKDIEKLSMDAYQKAKNDDSKILSTSYRIFSNIMTKSW